MDKTTDDKAAFSPHRYSIGIGLLAITAFFVASAFYTARFPAQQKAQGELVTQTQKLLNLFDTLTLRITEAETGQRGYLLTGQAEYLLPYTVARGRIDNEIQRTQQQIVNNPRQQLQFSALEKTIEGKLGELAETVNLYKAMTKEEALRIVLSGRGKDQMRMFRQQIEDMKTEERSSLSLRLAALDTAATKTRTILLLGGASIYALICAVYWALYKVAQQRKELTDAQRRVARVQQSRIDRLSQIVAIQHEIAGHATSLDEAMQMITERMQKLTHADGSVIEMFESNEMVYRAASGSAAPFVGLRLKADSSLSGRCVKQNAVLKCDDTETDPRVDRLACRKVGVRSMIVVPLRHQTQAIGVLKVMSSRTAAFSAEDTAALELMAGLLSATLADAEAADAIHAANQTLAQTNEALVSKTLELEIANTRLEILATTDGLTGLKNHRTFQEFLASEFERAKRYKKPLSLVLLDVDHFKKFNDTFGHPAGDAVLKRVATILQETARTTDLVARYGGEEFALLLPETGVKGASIIAERILNTIAGNVWQQRDITVSIGISSFDDRISSSAALLSAADEALYASKENGRNRVSQFLTLSPKYTTEA